MLKDLTRVVVRARSTAVEDAVGLVSLIVLLFAGLAWSGAA